ncbi:hypothetical protein HZA44_04060 [Candidatus Peregrinibacteria bacterium]|nr:hypothetical protein [Candidatus Peregrinibacteria bacterium]
MNPENANHHTFIVRAFSAFIEWGNQWLTLSHWIFKPDEFIFVKVETMMIVINTFCLGLLLVIHWVPSALLPFIYAFFVQRIAEFVIVYSRNFIFKRGRVYSQMHSDLNRGVWLILMFSLSLVQIILVFASWYRAISFSNPGAFSQPLGILDSVYFSMVTFLTIGFGDIVPVSASAKILMISQGVLTFFTIAIVINGLISTHFGGRGESDVD